MERMVLVVALLVSACGGKKAQQQPASEHKAAIDQYVNVDMQMRWAELWTGLRPFKTLKNDAIDRGLEDWFEGSMPEVVIPRMTEFLDGAAKISPPPPLAASHAALLEIATQYRDVGTEMLAAARAKDSPKFKTVHARMMQLSERYQTWQTNFDKLLAEHGVPFKDVPPLPDKPVAAPPKVTYCGDAPCPCAQGSEVKHGDKLSSCTLTAATEIQNNKCAEGKVSFYDDGTIKTCMFADSDFYRAGEAQFHPSGKIASATSNVLSTSYPGIVCGSGPARWFDDGQYEACTVHTGSSPSTIAGIELPARTRDAYVVFHPGGKPRYVKHADQERCLDPAGAPIAPCTAPTW